MTKRLSRFPGASVIEAKDLGIFETHAGIASLLSIGSISMLLAPGAIQAATGLLSWNPVDDSRSIVYELNYGEAGSTLAQRLETPETTISLPDLVEGLRYAFRIRACVSETSDPRICSAYSAQVEAEIPYSAPEAGFSGAPLEGSAPLTVVFTDTSIGLIDSREWSLGDGRSATGERVVHSYADPGSYSVSLSITGPGGSDTQIRPDYVLVTAVTPEPPAPPEPPEPPPPAEPALMESGTASVTHSWQWVPFQQRWNEPVLITSPLSSNDPDPAFPRIDALSPDGFFVRAQEWDYLDGQHPAETLSWMVMNAGRYQTANGRWIEAGQFDTQQTRRFSRKRFTATFSTPPLVFTTVVTNQDPAAVLSRVRRIRAHDFQNGLIEEEASDQRHGLETLNYLAIEPGSGQFDGQWLEAGSTPSNQVTDAPYPLGFTSSFSEPPAFLAQLQTTNNSEPAALRWSELSTTGVEVQIEEEQSRDLETTHPGETLGYLLIGQADDSLAGDRDETPEQWTLYEDAEDGNTPGWAVYAGPDGASIRNLEDTEKQSRVIVFEGAGWANGYRLLQPDGSPWADDRHQVISWEMRYPGEFHVYIAVEVSTGDIQYLEYTNAPDTQSWRSGAYIGHGLGADIADGRWHRIERDLAADLRAQYPDTDLLRVNAFLIRGDGAIDEIKMR